jgi:hypothetical protein
VILQEIPGVILYLATGTLRTIGTVEVASIADRMRDPWTRESSVVQSSKQEQVLILSKKHCLPTRVTYSTLCTVFEDFQQGRSDLVVTAPPTKKDSPRRRPSPKKRRTSKANFAIDEEIDCWLFLARVDQIMSKFCKKYERYTRTCANNAMMFRESYGFGARFKTLLCFTSCWLPICESVKPWPNG